MYRYRYTVLCLIMLLQRFIPPRNRTCAQLAIQATSLPVTHDPYPPKNYMHCFLPTVHTCMCKRRGLDRHAKSRQTLDMPSSTAPFSLDSAVILAFSISTDGPSSHEAFRRPPRVSPASSFRSTQSEGFVDNLPWLAGAEPFER